MNSEVNMNDLLNEMDMEETSPLNSLDSVIFDEAKNDFYGVIVERGEDYYRKGKVISVIKDNGNSIFKATVVGSYNNKYDVWIEYNLDEEYTYVDCGCSCPCDFPCKHEYAVLLSIRDGNYEALDFKEMVYKKTYNLYDVLKIIPADKIKEFLLSNDGKKSLFIDSELFEKNFISYLPVQSYEYYYNNLYNDVLVDSNDRERLDKFFNLIVDYFSSQMYEEVFKIIKSIIEVYYDTNNLYSQMFIVELFPKLSMFMRVLSKNCKRELKDELLDWAKYIKSENYYDSIFLQDVIDCIK